MFPSTPTPLPLAPTPAVVVDPHVWRVWAFADDTIMVWQQGQLFHADTVIQIGLLLVIVIFFVYYVYMLMNKVTNEGEL